MENNDNTNLIFGKDKTEGIVSIESHDGFIELFFEEKPSTFIPSKYWLLSDNKINNKFIKLKGELHYKYGQQFTKREDYLKYRSIYKKQGHDTYSIYDPIEASMINKGLTFFKGMKPEDVSVLSFDIESTGLNLDDTAKVLLITNTFRKNGKIERKLFAYDEHEDIFKAWSDWVNSVNPSVIVCHNGSNFDLPYMAYCANKCGR